MKHNEMTVRQIINFSNDDLWFPAPGDDNFDYFIRNLDYHIKNSSGKEKKRLVDAKALLKLAKENSIGGGSMITPKGKELIKSYMDKNGIQYPTSPDEYDNFLPFSRMITKKKLDPKYDKGWYEDQSGGFMNELLSDEENNEILYNEQADPVNGIPTVIRVVKNIKARAPYNRSIGYSDSNVWDEMDEWIQVPGEELDYFLMNLDYHIKNSSGKEKQRLNHIKVILELADGNASGSEISPRGKELIKSYMEKNGIQPPKSPDEYCDFLPFSRMITKKKLDPKYDKYWEDNFVAGYHNRKLSDAENKDIYDNEQADPVNGIPSVIRAEERRNNKKK